ncbi:MAG: GTPase Era [Bacteroidetes bacterium]|nr:GTPase Era [Bacteroidota bacterium]
MKAGYVALVGKPNVGKSTLLNSILNQKLSIVSKRPQTTRQRVLGILTEPDYQIIFIDTPGLIEPHYALQREMMKHAQGALKDAEVIVAIVDHVNIEEQFKAVQENVLAVVERKPVLCALNKIDMFDDAQRKMLEEKCSSIKDFSSITLVSATTRENLDVLLSNIIDYLPEHPAYYPEDIISDKTERFFVAELIRENIFELYYDEIPYASVVVVREFKEREQGKTYIQADIIVERESQKIILIGKNADALKKLGQLARQSIELFLEREVYLELHVAVRKKWRNNELMLRQFGYIAS